MPFRPIREAMSALSLLVIADDLPDGAALEQSAALERHLDRARFAVTTVVLANHCDDLTTKDRRSLNDSESPAPSPRPPAPVQKSDRWPVDPRALWKLRRLVAERRPDVVLTIGESASFYGAAAAKLAGCRRVVACWPDVEFDYVATGKAKLGRWLARRCERIVLASEAERDAAIAHGWPEDRIAVVPMAVTPLRRTMSRGDVFAKLGIAAASPVIGVVSPWLPRHRVKEAIWAFDLIRVVRGDVRMIVVGKGRQRAELELFCDQQACQGAIHFVDPDGLPPEWLAHCDMIWSLDPALRVSYATLVAAASGVPLVAVDTPGHRSFLSHGETGMLVPISVRPAAPQATLELLNDATLRRRIGELSGQRTAERHGEASVVAAFAAALQTGGSPTESALRP